MLGSFPPQEKRWSMVFYYPNFGNDMWRIVGLLFFGDPQHFVSRTPAGKGIFNKEEIVKFCTEKGIAMYDTATVVRRLKDNASDKFLEVVEPTDIPALLRRIPGCRAIVTTGQKATDVIVETFGCAEPAVGSWAPLTIDDGVNLREMRLYRMPSSSRAYPLPLPEKAARYRTLFLEEGML